MNRVIGTVPNINYPTQKDYVVEYNGDWWVGRVTVYRSLSGARCPYEWAISSLVNAAEFQEAAGVLKLKHYSYSELLDMYKPVKDNLEIKSKEEERTKNFLLLLLGVVIFAPWLLLK